MLLQIKIKRSFGKLLAGAENDKITPKVAAAAALTVQQTQKQKQKKKCAHINAALHCLSSVFLCCVFFCV